MISVDWQSIIAYLLLGASGLGGLAWGGKAAWVKWKARPTGTTPGRGADDLAPPGSIEWVTDVCDAMGSASAESKLNALCTGSTRDQARSLRISELEAKP